MAHDERLSPAMKRNLLELLDAPYWTPGSSGEWSCARAMEQRGLITRLHRAAFRDYELSASGRAVAEKLLADSGGSGASGVTR